MDVAAATWLWIVAAVALVVLLLALAALLRPRFRGREQETPVAENPVAAAGGFAEDDLPGFLEQPPGATAAPASSAGWTTLVAPPAPSPAPARRRRPLVVVAAVAAVVLVAAAIAALVASSDGDPSVRSGTPAAASSFDGRPGDRTPVSRSRGNALPTVPAAPSPGDAGAGALAGRTVRVGADGLAADLRFGGVVLERHAVGVTATYPRVRLTSNGRQALASVELPTWNCLADAAPEDPVAAGCSRTVTEYAELPTPALSVVRHGTGARTTVQLTGRFPTYTRPNGTPPVWTGSVYDLTVAAAADGSGAGRQVPATGEFRLGDDTATAVRGTSWLRYRR